MKKLILFAAVVMVSLFGINSAKAQVSLSVNIGSQPVWGPTGYDHVDYYYLPDINAYYYVPSGQYIYLNNGRWVWVNALPQQYNNFDLFRSYKVVINKPRPYLNNNIYVTQYAKYKNYGGRQSVIRDSRDTRYYVVKGHPNYKGNNKPQVVTPQNNVRPTRTQESNKKPNNQIIVKTNNARPEKKSTEKKEKSNKEKNDHNRN